MIKSKMSCKKGTERERHVMDVDVTVNVNVNVTVADCNVVTLNQYGRQSHYNVIKVVFTLILMESGHF